MLRCFGRQSRTPAESGSESWESTSAPSSESGESSRLSRRRKKIARAGGPSQVQFDRCSEQAGALSGSDGGSGASASSCRSGSSNSLDSASTACWTDTSGAAPNIAAPATPPALPPHMVPHRRSSDQQRLQQPSRQQSCEPPTPVAPLPTPGRWDTCDPGGRFTSLSFATRREPLTGNLRYRKIKDLNRGSVGFVQLARDTTTGQTVAIKFVERNHPSLAGGLLLREISNQRAAAGHPHVVQLREVFITQHHVAIVMEYCNGGDLSQYIEYVMVTEGQPVPEERVRRLFQQLMSGLDYCHKIGIANRDVKLDNLLLHNPPGGGPPVLKLCDFGLSKDEVDSASKSSCGTPEYMAPEVLMGDNYQGATSDVWSAGVALYTLVAGRFPFLKVEEEAGGAVERMAAMLPRIVRADYQPLPPRVSPECADLLSRMLTAHPGRRASVDEIMSHPWVAPGMAPLRRLNDALLSFVTQPQSYSPGSSHRPSPLRTHSSGRRFTLESDQNGVTAPALAEPHQPPSVSRGRAASLDLPRIGAAAANQSSMRAGGCRQSLAEIAGLLASAHAATSAANRRQHRSLDMQAHRSAAAAAVCQPAWQDESLSRTSM